jgi:hypothetical protein
LEELLFKVIHTYPQMYLKVTSTLSHQTPKQDPFLRWKQSRLLDVSLERYSDNASPEASCVESEVAYGTGTSQRSIKVTDTGR